MPEIQSSKKLQKLLYQVFNDSEFLENLPVIDAAATALTNISKKFEIDFYITSRTKNSENATQNWLSKNDFPDKPVVFRPDTIREPNWKIKYLSNLENYYLLIDDALEAICRFPLIGRTNLIWFNHYNACRPESIDEKNYLMEAKSWQDIANQLLA